MRAIRCAIPVFLAFAAMFLLLARIATSSSSQLQYRFAEFVIRPSEGGPADLDGNQVVWTYSGWIRGYDLATGQAWGGVPESYYATCPKISGDWVVWRQNAAAPDGVDYSVIAMNIRTGEVRVMAADGQESSGCSDVDGDHIVWPDDDGALWLYSISAEASTLVTNTGINGGPAIDWPWVTWSQQQSDPVIWAYNISTTEVFSLASGGCPTGVEVSDGLAVWRQDTPLPMGGRNIYGMNLDSREPFTLTYSPHYHASVHIDNPFVVWDVDYGHRSRIYMHDLTSGGTYTVTDPIHGDRRPIVSGNVIVWQRWLGGIEDSMNGAHILGRFLYLPLVLREV